MESHPFLALVPTSFQEWYNRFNRRSWYSNHVAANERAVRQRCETQISAHLAAVRRALAEQLRRDPTMTVEAFLLEYQRLQTPAWQLYWTTLNDYCFGGWPARGGTGRPRRKGMREPWHCACRGCSDGPVRQTWCWDAVVSACVRHCQVRGVVCCAPHAGPGNNVNDPLFEMKLWWWKTMRPKLAAAFEWCQRTLDRSAAAPASAVGAGGPETSALAAAGAQLAPSCAAVLSCAAVPCLHTPSAVGDDCTGMAVRLNSSTRS